MVDGISGVGTGSLTDALGGSPELDRDDFLRLLVEQIKNQDPLDPQENAAFVAELAQFSNLEQAIGMNERLDMLSIQQQGVANSQVVGLVGKEATVQGSIVTLDGSGVGTQISFSLDSATESTLVDIRDQTGNVIRTIDLGSRGDGVTTINWDGRDSTGNVMPEGSYAVSVTTEDAGGNPVSVSQETVGTVESVSFDQGYPVLTLSTGVSVPVSDLLRVKTSSSSE